MKSSVARIFAGLAGYVIAVGISGFMTQGRAQDNIWTSPASGNWEDTPAWSIGVLPGTNQTVWLTNSGWKAVQIGWNTAANFPQSLNVDSVVISSPTNSFNSLLLNYAGAGAPLTVKTMSVASNSSVTMISSALQINGPNGEGLTVGGQFNQNDSIVGGGQINVGYIGSGTYNFTGGYLAVSQLWLGGNYSGVFNQTGGTNAFGITHLDGGNGYYVLSNGLFGAAAYFNGGTFQQYGGLVQTNLTIFQGSYLLAGGVLQGDAFVPYTDGFTAGHASMLQTGGTHYGLLEIGFYGNGSYTMSNGVSYDSHLLVGPGGSFDQWDGTQTVTGLVETTEEQINQGQFSWGAINLHGGQISSVQMFVQGHYAQDGGTNIVAGDVTMSGSHASISLFGGLFAAENVTVDPSWVGGVFLSGGVMVITNELLINGTTDFPGWQGYLGGGQLIVSNIYLAPHASFSCRDGVINQSGTLTLANASLYAGSNPVQFGPLLLSDGGSTNSTLSMPSGASVVRFGDSSGMTWSNDGALVIENWNGSSLGGGPQQIIFGSSSAALTATQLAQIQFENPAGLAAGTYPAKILSTGEIVPASSAPAHPSMALKPQPGGMQVTLKGEAGRTYSIEVSTDLVHWVAWTNQTTSDGNISITDTESKNCPARFYRAKLMP